MKENLAKRKQKLIKSKEKMGRRDTEANIKYQKHIAIRMEIKIMHKYYYNELLKLISIEKISRLGEYFEFKDYEIQEPL